MRVINILIIEIILISTPILYSQIITSEYNIEEKIFRVSKNTNDIPKNDSINIYLQIINQSNSPFFIFDSTMLLDYMISYGDNNNIYFYYSMMEIRKEFTFKILRIVDVCDSINFNLIIPVKLLKKHLNNSNKIFFNIYFGYFLYNKELLLFTHPYKGLEIYRESIARDENKFNILINNYRQILMNCFDITIQK